MRQLIVFGLGYVGLPLALQLAKHNVVIGYDIDEEKIAAYKKNQDPSGECDTRLFEEVKSKIVFTSDAECLKQSKKVIVTVPTPVDSANVPDLTPLRKACIIIGQELMPNDLIIFESTVYPGATREFCVPILSNASRLTYLRDFNVGYSPERINPGDKVRNIGDVVKVISADCEVSLNAMKAIYQPIIQAGLFVAKSIEVAEAAKVLENTQRDINIALMNEISIICNKIGINTYDVLDAAETKWNFLKFSPGLVGGHCIGVDPYYLTYKSAQSGYHAEVVLAGRRINDRMADEIADRIVSRLFSNHYKHRKPRVLVLGLTFKENVRDIRNSKVFNLLHKLKSFNIYLDVFDPYINEVDMSDIQILNSFPKSDNYDCIIIAVAHNEFRQFKATEVFALLSEKGFIFDIKGMLRKNIPEFMSNKYLTL